MSRRKQAQSTGERFDCKAKVIQEGPLHNLQISLDYDTNPKKTYPVLLLTPHMRTTAEHYHIELNRAQAIILRDYLHEWLNTSARPIIVVDLTLDEANAPERDADT